MRLLLVLVLCGICSGADLSQLAKGALQETPDDLSGYCFGAVESSVEHQDAPWWAGFCRLKVTVEGFQIDANLVGPVRETYQGRTPMSLFLRDDPHTGPLIFLKFDNWISVHIQPNSQEVREAIIRKVNANGSRDPLHIRTTALIDGRPTNWDNPEIHSLTIDVVGVDWPLAE